MDMTAKTELQVEEITNSFKTELQVEEITDNSKMIATGSGVLDNVNKDLYIKINKERYFFPDPLCKLWQRRGDQPIKNKYVYGNVFDR